LFECASFEEMNKKEAEIVNKEFLARDDVYNICLGGAGGWDYLNCSDHSYCKGSAKRHNAAKLALKHRDLHKQSIKCKEAFDRMKRTGRFEDFRKHVSDGIKRHKQLHPDWMSKENNPMYGKTHSE